MVAKRTLTDGIRRKHDEKKQDNEIGNKAGNICDGKAIRGLIEEIDPLVAATSEGKENNGADLGHPDDPLDEITSSHLPVPCQEERLLASGCGTHPTAKGPA